MVYVSKKISIAPYEFINPHFKQYIKGKADSPDIPEHEGLTIYARFVPRSDNMLGHMLREGRVVLKPVAEGGGGGQCPPPQQEIKLKLCPSKLKFALAYFNRIYRSYK